jgi:Fe-S-cluster formation regulator IscX/YfhJ
MPNGPFYKPGRYEGQITGQRFATAGTGSKQFVITFKVLSYIDPSNPDQLLAVPAQYERSIYRTLVDSTIEYFFEDMRSLGIDGLASFGDVDPLNPGFIDLKDKVCDFTCTHEQNQKTGEMREKWYVARVNSGSAKPPIESLASNDVRNLDRLFGKHLKKPAGAAPRQAPTAATPPRPIGVPYPPPAGEGITDDDVPF